MRTVPLLISGGGTRDWLAAPANGEMRFEARGLGRRDSSPPVFVAGPRRAVKGSGATSLYCFGPARRGAVYRAAHGKGNRLRTISSRNRKGRTLGADGGSTQLRVRAGSTL